MIRSLRFALAAALAVGLLAALPAEAAVVNMCGPTSAGTAPGPRQWTAPSGTTYGLNNQGCVNIAPADVAGALAAGFTLRSQLYAVVANALVAAGTVTLPPGTYIDRIIVQETSGGAVTGGIKIGTAAAGTQVAAALICGASCLVWTPDASISTRIFANTAPQTLFIDAVSSFASSRVNVTVIYGYW